MGEPARYPVLLDLHDRPCLVVGGGPVATRKVRGLLAAGAQVRVVASAAGDDLLALALADDRVVVHQRHVYDEDLAGPHGSSGPPWAFVVAATDDRARNAEVVAAAERHGTWANDATDPRGGPASLPAVHRDGPLTIAVATDGVHPGAARWVRDRAADAIGPAPARTLELLEDLLTGVPDATRVDWRAVLDSGTLDAVSEGQLAEAKERLQACLSSSSD